VWHKTSSNTVALGLNLAPFAGIAFLWFIGVLRDRLGELEDRFFSTVFLGSGLLFLAMLFASAAVAGGIISAYAAKPEGLLASVTFTFARAATYEIMNIYTVKMAAPLSRLTVAGMQSFLNAAVRPGCWKTWRESVMRANLRFRRRGVCIGSRVRIRWQPKHLRPTAFKHIS
jgi:hypothetical protein